MVTVWRTVLLLSGYYCDSTHQHYDVTQFEYVLWHHTMHEWVMNIHYKTWIAQGRFTNMILTPSKQWGVCDNVFLSHEYICSLQKWYFSWNIWILIEMLHLILFIYVEVCYYWDDLYNSNKSYLLPGVYLHGTTVERNLWVYQIHQGLVITFFIHIICPFCKSKPDRCPTLPYCLQYHLYLTML